MPDYVIDVDVLLTQVRAALKRGDLSSAVGLLEALRPADQAGIFDDLLPEEQDRLIPHLKPEDSADILEELEEEDAAEVAERLKMDNLAMILDHMEPDEAADLLGDIKPEIADQALEAMVESDEVRPLLIHKDETAGGLMTTADITLRREMTAEQAISYLRKLSPESESIYYLFVVDDQDELVGVVNLRDLVVAPRKAKIKKVMNSEVISIQANADQEEAALIMKRYDLLALPVIDKSNHLLGVITYDDSFDILEEEATEDIYRLGGVVEETPLDVPLLHAVRSRLPWLVVNLFMALISAAVLSRFEDTIAQMAALAAFFPIVAGVSGSSGTQTLTVTVRSLATGELEPKDALKVIPRSLSLGAVNGITIGALIALIAYLWKGIPELGLVAGIATMFNMLVTSIAGVLVPFLMNKLKFDPALASPILVTTLSDSLGYLVYLGLASVALVWFI
jgi:magnesium transporter